MEASTSSSPPSPSSSDAGKIFVGGISPDAMEEELAVHFAKYGEVKEALVIRDRETKFGKGFGFVKFVNPEAAQKALDEKENHVIGGRVVQVRPAVQKNGQNRSHCSFQQQYMNQGPSFQQQYINQGPSFQQQYMNQGPSFQQQFMNQSPSFQQQYMNQSPYGGEGRNNAIDNNGSRLKKIFVGGLPESITEEDLKKHFETFGPITDAVVMYDSSTRRPRGFGFVTFELESSAEEVLKNSFHYLNGKKVEAKRAIPKDSRNHSNNNVYDGNGAVVNMFGQVPAIGNYPCEMYPPRYDQFHGFIPAPWFAMSSYGAMCYAGPGPSTERPWNAQAMTGAQNLVPYTNASMFPCYTNETRGGYMIDAGDVQSEQNNNHSGPNVQSEACNNESGPNVQLQTCNNLSGPDVQPETCNNQSSPDVQPETGNNQSGPDVQPETGNNQSGPDVQPETGMLEIQIERLNLDTQ